jgi:hypothetical protein
MARTTTFLLCGMDMTITGCSYSSGSRSIMALSKSNSKLKSAKMTESSSLKVTIGGDFLSLPAVVACKSFFLTFSHHLPLLGHPNYPPCICSYLCCFGSPSIHECPHESCMDSALCCPWSHHCLFLLPLYCHSCYHCHCCPWTLQHCIDGLGPSFAMRGKC